MNTSGIPISGDLEYQQEDPMNSDGIYIFTLFSATVLYASCAASDLTMMLPWCLYSKPIPLPLNPSSQD